MPARSHRGSIREKPPEETRDAGDKGDSMQRRLEESAQSWHFVNEEANLMWTIPGKLDRANLWTILSPTLLLGYQEHGSIMPTQYIKIGDVQGVMIAGDTGIKVSLAQKDGREETVLGLRCGDRESRERFYLSLQMAVRGCKKERRDKEDERRSRDLSGADADGGQRGSVAASPGHGAYSMVNRVLAELGRTDDVVGGAIDKQLRTQLQGEQRAAVDEEYARLRSEFRSAVQAQAQRQQQMPPRSAASTPPDNAAQPPLPQEQRRSRRKQRPSGDDYSLASLSPGRQQDDAYRQRLQSGSRFFLSAQQMPSKRQTQSGASGASASARSAASYDSEHEEAAEAEAEESEEASEDTAQQQQRHRRERLQAEEQRHTLVLAEEEGRAARLRDELAEERRVLVEESERLAKARTQLEEETQERQRAWEAERDRNRRELSETSKRRDEEEHARATLYDDELRVAGLRRESEVKMQGEMSERRLRFEQQLQEQKRTLRRHEESLDTKRRQMAEEERLWEERRRAEEEELRGQHKRRAEQRQALERQREQTFAEDKAAEEALRNERRLREEARRQQEDEERAAREAAAEEASRAAERRREEDAQRRADERRRAEEAALMVAEQEAAERDRLDALQRAADDRRRAAEDEARLMAAEEAARRAAQMTSSLQQALDKAENLRRSQRCRREREPAQRATESLSPHRLAAAVPTTASHPYLNTIHAEPEAASVAGRGGSDAGGGGFPLVQGVAAGTPRARVTDTSGSVANFSDGVKLTAPHPFETVSGLYCLRRDKVNSWPSWGCTGRGFIYATKQGYWAVVDEEADMINDAGLLQSSVPHYGRPPTALPWDSASDGKWKKDVRVVVVEAPLGRVEPSASPPRSSAPEPTIQWQQPPPPAARASPPPPDHAPHAAPLSRCLNMQDTSVTQVVVDDPGAHDTGANDSSILIREAIERLHWQGASQAKAHAQAQAQAQAQMYAQAQAQAVPPGRMSPSRPHPPPQDKLPSPGAGGRVSPCPRGDSLPPPPPPPQQHQPLQEGPPQSSVAGHMYVPYHTVSAHMHDDRPGVGPPATAAYLKSRYPLFDEMAAAPPPPQPPVQPPLPPQEPLPVSAEPDRLYTQAAYPPRAESVASHQSVPSYQPTTSAPPTASVNTPPPPMPQDPVYRLHEAVAHSGSPQLSRLDSVGRARRRTRTPPASVPSPLPLPQVTHTLRDAGVSPPLPPNLFAPSSTSLRPAAAQASARMYTPAPPQHSQPAFSAHQTPAVHNAARHVTAEDNRRQWEQARENLVLGHAFRRHSVSSGAILERYVPTRIVR